MPAGGLKKIEAAMKAAPNATEREAWRQVGQNFVETDRFLRSLREENMALRADLDQLRSRMLGRD